MANRRIGLSLGADICWPICYEEIVKRLQVAIPHGGDTVGIDVERAAERLVQLGVTKVPYKATTHPYFQLPGGPVLRLARR